MKSLVALFDIQRKIGDVFTCPDCLKSTTVKTVPSTFGVQPEKVSSETHCACRPESPAYVVPRGAA